MAFLVTDRNVGLKHLSQSLYTVHRRGCSVPTARPDRRFSSMQRVLDLFGEIDRNARKFLHFCERCKPLAELTKSVNDSGVEGKPVLTDQIRTVLDEVDDAYARDLHQRQGVETDLDTLTDLQE